MKTRQLIGGASFPPDILHVMFEAFDEAWVGIAPTVGAHPSAAESARLSLATIILSLAHADLTDLGALKTAAVEAYRLKHRLSA
jgi:hypothetical protein